MSKMIGTTVSVSLGVALAFILYGMAHPRTEAPPSSTEQPRTFEVQEAEARVSTFLGRSARQSSIVLAGHDDAIETEEEAEDHAVDEIAPSFNPSNPVARLLRAKGVGEWLGTCMDWPGDNPYWLVGVETTGQPQFDGEELTGSWVEDGVYVILSANSGDMVGFGTLNSTNHSYASIANLSSENLTITYKTPVTLEGAAAGTAPATVGVATIEALPTAEANCRATEWAP